MTLSLDAEALLAWSERTRAAHLELPTGSLGRPGNDLYRLLTVEADEATLILNFEHRFFFTLVNPEVRITELEAVVKTEAPVEVERKDFGAEEWRRETLPPGEVRMWVHSRDIRRH